MTIQFLKSRLVGRDILNPGAVCEVPDDLAKTFIERGIAVLYVPGETPELKVERATTRNHRKAATRE